MKRCLTIIALGSLLSACSATSTYKPKESNWIGWGERNKGYSEEKISSNRWLIKYHVNEFTNDAEILKLLYRRVDEFGSQVCSKGFDTNSQSIGADYSGFGGNPVGKVGSVILICKD